MVAWSCGQELARIMGIGDLEWICLCAGMRRTAEYGVPL